MFFPSQLGIKLRTVAAKRIEGSGENVEEELCEHVERLVYVKYVIETT